MLNQVLSELQATQGTVRLSELAAHLNVEPGALEGMLAFWESKGKINPIPAAGAATLPLEKGKGKDTACLPTCSGSCPGAAQCPFVAKMPRMWENKG